MTRDFRPPHRRPLKGPPSTWPTALQDLWHEVRFAVDPEVAIQQYRVGFVALVETIALYRQLRDQRPVGRGASALRRLLVPQLRDWGVRHGDRRRVLEGVVP